MKKIILLFLIIVSINYNLKAQIALTGNITTAGVAVYPTHIDSLGRGGFMTLPDLTTRNAMPVKRRKQGMLVYVQANDSLYKLNTTDLSNTGWVAMGLLTQQNLSDSLNSRLKAADTLSLSNRIELKANTGNITDVNNELVLKLNIIDTAFLLQKLDTSFLLQKKDTANLSNRIDLKASITALNNLNTTNNNKFIIDTSYLLQKSDTASLSNRINLKTNTDDFTALTTTVGTKFKTTDTSYLLQKTDTASLSNRINLKANTDDFTALTSTVGTKFKTTDTSYLLQKTDTATLSNRINLKANTTDVNTLTTTVGTKFKTTDTSYLLQKTDTASLSNRINLKLDASKIGVKNGVASLNASGVIPSDQIPPISFSSVDVVNSQAEMLSFTNGTGLTTDRLVGSIVVRVDSSKNFVLARQPASVRANWTELLTPAPPVQSVNGHLGTVMVTPLDLHLDSVDNTRDIDKPVSNPTKNVLALKFKTTDTSYLLQKTDTASLSNRINLKASTTDVNTLTTSVGTKFKTTDTSYLLQKSDTASLSNRINLKANTTDVNTLTTSVGTKFKTTDTSYLLQKTDTASLSNRINKKLNITDTSFLLKKTDTSFLLKKADTSYLLQKVDTTAILAMYAKKFTKDVVVNFGGGSFGKYANGTTIPAKGKTLDEFLYDVLTKQIPPTYSGPSVSISASPSFGAYEIGYNPGLITLSNTYTKNDAGNVTLVTYNKGGISLGAGVNTNTPGPITNSISYNVSVNYGAGTTVKNDNLGNPYPTGQITAGSTSSGSGAYSTYSKRYWGGTSVAFTASNTYNYAALSQALGSDNSGSSNAIILSLTPTGTQNIFFAYLATSPDLSSILYNGLENIDAFTKTLITITNAQGHAQSYKVYTSKEVYSSMLKDIIFK
jgi:hypothetical protein